MKPLPRVCGLAALGLVACLGGCATQKPAVPPLLDLAGFHCGATPDLAQASKLGYDPKKDENKATVEISAASPCFKDSAGPSLYAAYELPSVAGPYLVRVNSEPEGETLLAPRILLYGSGGELRRQFSGKRIVFRGADLSVIFRSHDDERYLVIASDPAAVGRKLARVQDATQSAMVSAYPVAYFTVYTGTDATVNNVLAQNGRVTVSLEPLAAK